MTIDKEIYDAVQRVFLDLIVPQLEALRADLRRLEEKLDAHPQPLAPSTSSARIPPPSPQGQAYIDQLCAEIREGAEQRAQEWAERRAKDPQARIRPKDLYGSEKGR